MAGAMCINVVDSSQEVCCPIRPGTTNWNKTFIPLRAESVAGFVGAPSEAGGGSSSSSKQAAAAAGKQQASSNQRLPP